MSPPGPSVPWGDFTQDPRTPQAAPLRASDRDRDVVTGVLTEAYADGRLTREEYDERADAAASAKTLGQLPPLIHDLVPQTPLGVAASRAAVDTPEALHARAVQHWQSQRLRALTRFLIPTLVCWVVWLLALQGSSGYPWPLWVMLGTGINVLRVQLQRRDIIAEEERRLERRQRTALEGPRSRTRPDDG
jgi:hypothetical protein